MVSESTSSDELTGALALAAKALQAPPPAPLPAQFAARVAQRAATPVVGPLDSLAQWVAGWFRPRTVQVRPIFQLALVAALCVVTGAVTLWTAQYLPGDEATVLVRFAVAAPAARSVAVAGDFNRWDPGAVRLQDAEGDGVWQALVPMHPGVYQYMFVIDEERWITDPLANESVDDGFGQHNSLMRIGAGAAAADDDDGDFL